MTLDLGAEEIEDEERREQLLETGRWSREQLGAVGLEFLRGFEATVALPLGGKTLLCCHATPHSNEDVVLPSTPRGEAEQAIGAVGAEAVAAGHVHLQWLRRFTDVVWFCVGSVGLVYEHKEPLDELPFLPFSEYALVDDNLAIEFRRIPFDVEELIEVARAKGFPGFERWAAMWNR